MTISFKKYKKFRASSILLKLSNIFNKSTFIGFFQFKSFNLDEWIQVKQLIFSLSFKIIICKNTLLKKDALIPSVLMSTINQGNLLIFYSFSNLPNLEIINNVLNRAKSVPLFFYFFKKFVFLKKLSMLLQNNKANFIINLVILLENHKKSIFFLLADSNRCIFNILRI